MTTTITIQTSEKAARVEIWADEEDDSPESTTLVTSHETRIFYIHDSRLLEVTEVDPEDEAVTDDETAE